jgi:hypothetical protein
LSVCSEWTRADRNYVPFEELNPAVINSIIPYKKRRDAVLANDKTASPVLKE